MTSTTEIVPFPGVYAGDEPEIYFGPQDIEFVRLAYLNVLPRQVRTQYNSDSLEELAESMTVMRSNGDVSFNMLNPLLVGRFDDRTKASKYLQEYNKFYNVNIQLGELVQDGHGRYTVHISGHRRLKAIDIVAQKHDIPVDDIYAASSVHENPTFEDALVMQMRENVHVRPDVLEEARILERYHHLHPRSSIAEIARKFTCSPAKVSAALQFALLPQDVQRYVARGALTYSSAVALAPLQKAYHDHYNRMRAQNLQFTSAKVREAVDNAVCAAAYKIVEGSLKGSKSVHIREYIRAKIDAITKKTSIEQDGLFVLEEEKPADVRQRRRSALAQTALTILDLEIDNLPPETQQRLLAIAERIGAAGIVLTNEQPRRTDLLFTE